MRLDDGKSNSQGAVSRYGPGMALFALGVACKCAWDHHVAHRIVLPPAFKTQGAADLQTILASEEFNMMPSAGPSSRRFSGNVGQESLEDALKSLEMDGAEDAALEAMIAEQRKTSKGSKTTQPSKKKQKKVAASPTASSPERHNKESSKKKPKESKKGSTSATTVEDALAKLEGKRSTAAAGDGEAEPELSEEELIEKLKELFGGLDDQEALPPLKAATNKAGDADGKQEEPSTIADLDDGFHVEFHRRLTEERAREAKFNISEIKKIFKAEYESHHKNLLCSGCKLVTARLGAELDTHSVPDQENPALMLTAVRNAIESTCSSVRHLDVVPHEKGYKFEAGEAAAEEAELRIGQKLCHSLLEEARFDILQTLMRKKVTTWHVPSSEENWERRICAGTAKFCKRSETQEDRDDEREL